MKKLLVLVFLAATNLPVLAGNEPQPVSLMRLKTNPENFDGKRIVVVGFFGLEPGDRLFLHYRDYEHGIPENGIRIEATEMLWKGAAGLRLQYVLVRGVFHLGKDRDDEGFINAEAIRSWSRLDYPLTENLRDLIRRQPLKKGGKPFDKLKIPPTSRW